MRDKPALITGTGCMKKVKMIMKIIKKDRDIAIPSLCEFNAETQTQLIYTFCLIVTPKKNFASI